MKFYENYKFPNCLFNDENTVLKTKSLDFFPRYVKNTIFDNTYYITDESNLGNIVKGKGIYDDETIELIKIQSLNGWSFFDYKLIKNFMQKSSKYYISKSNYPAIIINKNYVILITPVKSPNKFIIN